MKPEIKAARLESARDELVYRMNMLVEFVTNMNCHSQRDRNTAKALAKLCKNTQRKHKRLSK